MKSKLATLKDKKEIQDDRIKEADELRREQEERIDKAEDEAESFKRRIKLIEEERERVEKTYGEKTEKLEELEKKCHDEEDRGRELEGVDQENDEQITRLEGQISEALELAEQAEGNLAEAMQKWKVVVNDLAKASERGDIAEDKEEGLESAIRSSQENMQNLASKDEQAAEMEGENEEKIIILQDLLTEETGRAEDAERKVPPLELSIYEVTAEIVHFNQEKNKTEREMEEMEELVNEGIEGDCDDEKSTNIFNRFEEKETEQENDPGREPEPEPEHLSGNDD